MRAETALVVTSKLQDGPCADDLRKWVVAVAYGKPVLVDNGLGPIERFRFQPALGRTHDVMFTQKFARTHPELPKITSAIAGGHGSTWRVRPVGASSRNAWVIDSNASFARMLRSMIARA